MIAHVDEAKPPTAVDEAYQYGFGNVTNHSSDEGGVYDVGIGLGLGDGMLFAGEVPGLRGPWSLVFYPADEGERIDYSESIEREAGIALIDAFAAWNRRAALPPAPDAVEALVKSEHTRLSMTPAQFANMERWRGYTEGLDAMRDAALAAIRAGGGQ
jgi:hypothetical protein